MSRSEFDIIRQYFSGIGTPAHSPGVVLGVGDDAAVLQIPSSLQQCVSTDMLVESVHFPVDAPSALVGQKALSVNLSDLAAMGARPFCFTLSLSLPEYNARWLEGFSEGLSRVAERYACPLVGGDTCTGPLVISIQVLGLAEPQSILRRDGARVGDAVLVTGTLGKGALGLAAMGLPVHFDAGLHEQLNDLSPQARETLENFYYCPQPRLDFARQAAPYINSAIDVSDGLVGDLGHIVHASGAGAIVDSSAIPFAPAVVDCTSPSQRLEAALYGGDDYELCFTAAKENLAALKEVASNLQLQLTEIGEIDQGEGLRIRDQHGNLGAAQTKAYRHFQKEPIQ